MQNLSTRKQVIKTWAAIDNMAVSFVCADSPAPADNKGYKDDTGGLSIRCSVLI